MEGFEISSSSKEDLPSDTIFEILTRISLETLRRSRSVCKDWLKFTHESYFTLLHCHRTGTISGYFVQSVKNSIPHSTFISMDQSSSSLRLSLNFLPCEVKIEASSNQGLLLCVSQGRRIPRYYICKPTTKEYRSLPNPKTRYVTRGTAMVVQSNPLRFNIVRFSQSKSRCYNLLCETFDSKYWAWKQSKDVQLPESCFLKMGHVISSNGAFHWLTNQNCIFAFDISQKSWKMIPLPEEAMDMDTDFPDHKLLVQREGKLSLFCVKKVWMKLWVLIDYSNEVWIKQQQVNLETLNRQEQFSKLVDLHTTDVALMKSFYKVIWYNCKDFTSTETEIDDHIDCQEVYTFQSDLESGYLNHHL